MDGLEAHPTIKNWIFEKLSVPKNFSYPQFIPALLPNSGRIVNLGVERKT